MAQPELLLHKAVVVWLRLTLGQNFLWFHIPNGGRRSAKTGAMLKDMGAVPGVPDLQFIWSANGVPTVAYIELKSGRGSLNRAQKRFRDSCADIGIPHAECRSLAEVAAVLSAWGLVTKTQAIGAGAMV